MSVFEDVLRIKKKYLLKAQTKAKKEVPSGVNLSKLPPPADGTSKHRKPAWSDHFSDDDEDDDDDDHSGDYSEDADTKDNLNEVTCSEELGIDRVHVDQTMLFLYDQIGVLEKFATPKFLADCAPEQFVVSYEHANTPRELVPYWHSPK